MVVHAVVVEFHHFPSAGCYYQLHCFHRLAVAYRHLLLEKDEKEYF
jgi:hypothetical protein